MIHYPIFLFRPTISKAKILQKPLKKVLLFPLHCLLFLEVFAKKIFTEIIPIEDKEDKMTLEEAIVQLQAAKTLEEDKMILDSKEDLIEEEDDLANQKEFKEDTTQDSRRDKSKTEEINKLEEVLEEIKEMQDQICPLEPIGCKKTPRQNSQREKKNPSCKIETRF